MVVRAMEAEVALFIDKQADEVDESGHRKVVRNGHMPVRELVTGIGRGRSSSRGWTTAKGQGMGREVQQRPPAALLKGVASVDTLIPVL